MYQRKRPSWFRLNSKIVGSVGLDHPNETKDKISVISLQRTGLYFVSKLHAHSSQESTDANKVILTFNIVGTAFAEASDDISAVRFLYFALFN